jgi:hypothetical protein
MNTHLFIKSYLNLEIYKINPISYILNEHGELRGIKQSRIYSWNLYEPTFRK